MRFLRFADIVVKGGIAVTGTDNANKSNKKLTFNNNAPLRSCIPKTNNTFMDNAGCFDIVMPICNLWQIFYHIRSIIEMKWMIMWMKIMMLVIIGQITTRQQQVNLLSIRQKWKFVGVNK